MNSKEYAKEIWKPIKDYEGIYEISSFGRVRSLDRETSDGKKIKGIILKPVIGKTEYRYINLYNCGKQKTARIHRLVAETFIANPNNLPIAGHWNDIKTDNNINNLYWTTFRENHMHNDIHLRIGEKCWKKIKGTLNDVVVVFGSAVEAGRNGFNRKCISECLNGRHKTHKGYTWELIGNNQKKEK